MADIIDLASKLYRDNLIVAQPLEFRRGDWGRGYALLCTRKESKRYEDHRQDALRHPQHHHIRFVPNHVTLDGGYHYTVLGLFRHRGDEAVMRRVYRLAGFMECVTNVPSPVLRTDLLRRFYQSVLEERETLGVVWRGDARNFMFPLHPDLYDPDRFARSVSTAESLKDLYSVIETETGTQFDILCSSYVIYLPEALGSKDS